MLCWFVLLLQLVRKPQSHKEEKSISPFWSVLPESSVCAGNDGRFWMGVLLKYLRERWEFSSVKMPLGIFTCILTCVWALCQCVLTPACISWCERLLVFISLWPLNLLFSFFFLWILPWYAWTEVLQKALELSGLHQLIGIHSTRRISELTEPVACVSQMSCDGARQVNADRDALFNVRTCLYMCTFCSMFFVALHAPF